AVRFAVDLVLAVIGLVILLAGLVSLLIPGWRNRGERPRLFWGTAPIKSLTYMSRAMREGGYESDTVVDHMYRIVKPGDFDHIVCVDARHNPLVRRVGDALLGFVFLARAL